MTKALCNAIPSAPGWSGDGHRVKVPLEHSRNLDKTWVHGGLRVSDDQEISMYAPPRNSGHYQHPLLQGTR